MTTYKQILKPKVIINSAIAGGLVLFGSISSGQLTWASLGFALAGAGVAFLTQLKEEIKPNPKSKKGELKLFNFI